MNRAIISQRITSILAEIERLNNALYAMNTTDIQRYPDNYEVLSTDAALRADHLPAAPPDLCHYQHQKRGISAVC